MRQGTVTDADRKSETEREEEKEGIEAGKNREEIGRRGVQERQGDR